MIKLPFGLCDVTYGDTNLTTLQADAAVFEATPHYKKMYGGKMEPFYLLQSYDVSFTLSLAEESYQNLTLAMPQLQAYSKGGYFDNPSRVDTSGMPLIIHPKVHGDDRYFDIVILRAIPDPENPFTKTYGKQADKYNVKFIGLPSKQVNDEKYSSYFYIGDWQASGVIA